MNTSKLVFAAQRVGNKQYIDKNKFEISTRIMICFITRIYLNNAR